ncbi:MAG: conserved hypothetical rane protein, partial [Rhodocyclaceae bacterium]|nr:conserved hypothetical rane protein [Rhodocyclaceae bacterium]
MNKSYRLIWSDLIQAWVAVAEFARARGKKAGAVLCAAGLASGALAAPPAPTALPTGGQIVAGQVAIAQGGARMDITQGSAKAIINWSSFDIGSSAQVHFHQPSASAMALNRVQSSDPSQIFGQLSANGQVFLVNPNGVLFGPGARVDVGGIVASTLNLANEDFLAGNYRFTGGNGAAGITNQGLLTALPQGYVALVAPKIANTGTINAPRGTVALAAGDTVTLQFANDRLLSYDVAAAQVDTLIAQQGAVRAEGGVVLLTAKSAGELATSAINHTGLTDASSASAEGGMIRLEGGFVAMGGSVKADGQTQGGHIEVQAAGTLSLAENVSAVGHGGAGGSVSYASGGRTIETSTSHTDASGATDGGSIRVDAKGGILSSGTYVAKGGSTGGRIDVGGDTVRLLSANLDASGNAGGGLVRVGGAFQGGKGVPDATAYDLFVARWPAAPAIGNSRRVFLNDGTRVNVSSSQGVGGTVVVWSNQETTQLGSINAAGAQGGGAVEISSAEVLRHAGLSGISGARFLLLDPKNIIIGDAAAVSSWSYQAVLGKDYTSSGSNANANSLEGGDWFGFAVAINSAANLMAVGTHGDDGATNGASDSGAVHLFRFTDGSFGGGSLEGIIGRDYTGGKNVNVPGLYAGAYFGRSVALNGAGDRLAVGATFYGSGGSVFLFSFTDSSFSGGTQQAIIGYGSTGGKNVNASFLDYNDAFGSSVALNAVGDRLAVGAVSDGGYNNTQPYTGAVHLFSFTDGNFSGGTLQGTVGKGYSGSKDIDMPTLPAGRFFGQAVALNGNGDRLAVGVGDDGFSASATNSGAVHLFSFTDGNFSGGSLQGTIGYGYTGGKNVSVANLEAGDYFGSAVSFNAAGDRLAVGAPSDGGYMNLAGGSGAVYLFSFTDTSFTGGSLSSTLGKGYTLANQVNVANLEANDSFGQAVALNGIGDRLAVGGSGDWGSGNILANSNSGAVRLFTFENNTFIGGIHVGTVGKGYTGGKNVNVASLEMSDGFGSAVALNAAGDRLAVGVPNDAGFGNAVLNSGAVHLFSFTDKNFNGAVLEASLGKGYTGGKNIDVASLEMGDRFGQSVALNGTGKLLAVGAPYDSGSGNVATSAGAVYLFSFLDNTFSSGSLVGTVGKGYTGGNNVDVPSLEMSDGFGSAVALNAVGDRLAVGAPNDAGFGNGVLNSGAVHLFSFTDGSFSGGTLQATLGKGYSGGKNIDVSNLAMGDRFGQSVAFNTSGTRLAVGAPFDTPPPPDDSLTGTGAVYLFGFLDNLFLGGSLLGTIGWGYTGIKDINMGSLEMNDNFGFSVALNAAGDRLAVGTPNDAGFGNGAMNSGAVYLFSFTDGSFTGGTLQSTLGKGYGGANDANVSDLESNDRFGQSVALNAAGNRLAVGALNDSGPSNATASSGAVYLFSDTQKAGSDSALGQTFANHADQSITVSRVDLETQLGMGTSVVLQASNDITVSGPIIVTPASGNGGNLTLQAGRNINFNANITTANGSLTAIAGDGGADPAFRDPGTPTLTIASGVILNVGTGIATLAAIAGNVVNNAGDGAIATSGAGRWLVYAADPSSTTEGFTNYNKHYNQIYDVAGTTPTYASTGNWFLYSLAPTLSVTPGAATITYGNATPTFVAASYSGFIDGDSSPGTVTGTANWTVGGPFSTAGHATAGSHNVTYGSGLLSSLGYLFTDNTGSTAELTVNARALTAAGITASNKIYDATLAATLNFGSAALSGVIAGDLLSLDTSGASGTFANKNVGTGKAVTVTGLALSGTDAGNYTVSDASGATAGIAARAITATGI